MGILSLNDQLAGLRNAASTTGNTTAAPAAAERKDSEFWLNVGVVIEGAGKDGEDLFVSPFGMAMDRLKPEVVRRGDSHYGQLVQVKNHVLALAQEEVAKLAPGEFVDVPLFTVRLYRKSEPAAPTADAATNPLMAAFERQVGSKS